MPLPPPPPSLPVASQPRADLFPAWGLLRRNRHVTVPLLAVPAGFTAAGEVLAHLPTAGMPTVVGAAVATAAVAGFAHHKWDRTVEQWYARASVAAAGAWLSATAVMGLGIPEWIALGAGAVAWGIPWWWHKRPRRRPGEIVALWAAWWQHYAPGWGLAGSQVIGVTTAGVIDTLHVQLWAGKQHLKHVDEIKPLIESALRGHVAPGMTRCETNDRRGDQVLIHLKRANPHDVEIEWEPSLAPTSATGVMPLGKDEAGEWVKTPVMALNWFIIGALGGGKSNELSVMLASITNCPDARVWLIDRKGGKAARPWIGAVDWVATTVEEARLMLDTLIAEVRARALHGYDGNEEMTPTPHVPAIFLVIDEAHNIVSNTADAYCQARLSEVASECRSSAVRVIVLTQYGALHESVGTDQTRGNLKNRICFKVAEASHGQFALEDWAKLNAARLENPGEFYYRLDGTQASAPCRGPHMPHPLIREIAARNAQIGRPPLVLYATEHQDVYDSRHDRLPAVFRPRSATPPEVPVTVAEPPWAERLREIEDEVAAIPDLAAPPPVDDATLRRTVEGKKRLWARLLQQAPGHGIKPAQLESGSGLGHTWTQEQLKALVAAGVVTKISTGRYAPVAGQDVWAGLEAVKAGVDRLAELAGV